MADNRYDTYHDTGNVIQYVSQYFFTYDKAAFYKYFVSNPAWTVGQNIFLLYKNIILNEKHGHLHKERNMLRMTKNP